MSSPIAPPVDVADEASRPLNALLLCGGGSRGAIEIGFYSAIVELGIPIDVIFGASVGAMNGALIAAGFTPAQLAALWSRFERRTLFPFNWHFVRRGWQVASLFRAERLVEILHSALPVRRFEELQIPLVVAATDLVTGAPVYLDSGELLPALLASTALPPYLPPVEHLGRQFIDGGIAANLPIGEAVARGARRIFALLCHCSEENVRPPRGFVEIQARAMRIVIERHMRSEIARYQDRAELIILEPCFDFPPSILRIEAVASLVEQSYQFARAELLRRTPEPGRTRLSTIETITRPLA